MNNDKIAIEDMQCWVFRHAQRKWNISGAECAKIFKEYDLLSFISECYDLLHVSGYQHALDEIEGILHSKGVQL